jgi:hypothetical protein
MVSSTNSFVVEQERKRESGKGINPSQIARAAKRPMLPTSGQKGILPTFPWEWIF